MPLSPKERYKTDLAKKGFERDPAQANIVEKLHDLYVELCSWHERKNNRSNLLVKTLTLFGRMQSVQVIKGIYMWGGVGRGKTYLMDCFYDSLPFQEKRRTHFHRFMKSVHYELKQLKEKENPLELVAEKFARSAKVICFDEFFVADITDAMILANLLDGLFRRGVVLVTTSNIEPEGLYKDGLQRARFIPAIDLLNKYTQVVNVDGGVDYRLRTLEKAALYCYPLGDAAHNSLEDFFNEMASGAGSIEEKPLLEIEGRHILAVKEADDIVWFDFKALCDGPRSQNDYIEIAKEYHAVIVAQVPEFNEASEDQARRFIYLVDEFYDRGVKLIMSAEKPIQSLYLQGRLSFEFERTISRVLEMQSKEYLARQHLA